MIASRRLISNCLPFYSFGMERDSKGLAIVIKSTKIRERDRLLTLFSPSLGIVNAVSYGARKSIKGIKAPLYTEGTFSLEKGRGGMTLKDIDVISTHDALLEDLDSAQSAMLFSDLILTARSSEPELYALYTAALDALESESFEKVTVEFLVHFLSLEGISGDYTTCPICGKDYDKAEILGFSSSEGVPVCQDCDTMNGALLLPPNARAYLKRSLELDFQDSLDLHVSEEQEHRIFRYLLRTLPFSFPGKLRSLEYGIWRI